MEPTNNNINPILSVMLMAMTIISSAVANAFQYADLFLSIITKIIPIISFILFLVINYEKIIENSKNIWKKLPKRKRKKK